MNTSRCKIWFLVLIIVRGSGVYRAEETLQENNYSYESIISLTVFWYSSFSGRNKQRFA